MIHILLSSTTEDFFLNDVSKQLNWCITLSVWLCMTMSEFIVHQRWPGGGAHMMCKRWVTYYYICVELTLMIKYLCGTPILLQMVRAQDLMELATLRHRVPLLALLWNACFCGQTSTSGQRYCACLSKYVFVVHRSTVNSSTVETMPL